MMGHRNLAQMLLTHLFAITPATLTWSPKVALVMIVCNVIAIGIGKATIKYGNKEEVIESPQAFPVSFTISKSTVIEELDTNGYLQVQISVTPASAQAEVRTVTFRYEAA